MTNQVNNVLQLLLNAELANADDLPCKSAVLHAQAVVLLAQLCDDKLSIEQQVILDDFKSLIA